MPTFSTAGRLFGGVAVDRSVFRKLLPNARWFVYAAGKVDPRDTNAATIALVYEEDNGTTVTLGSVNSAASAGFAKFELGPFDVFNTGGVPVENIPFVRLKATKTAGVDGEIQNSCIWLRCLPQP